MAVPMTTTPSGPLGFSTRAIRAAGRTPVVDQEPTAVPIYQTATFRSSDAAELTDVLTGARRGYAYARIDNPTSDALGAAVAELEGAEAGYAFGSGMGAVFATLASILAAGDEVVATRAIYGTTQSLLLRRLARLGITTRLVDATELDAVERSLTPGTRVLYLETIANPTITVLDIEALATLAHRRGIVVVVDNTFASPYLCRPVELGADLVVESATKWLAGHSDVVAGVVAGSHGLVRAIREFQVDTGGIIAPFSAFLVLRGIETLAVRMDRHCASALTVATTLESHPAVRRVYYPGLESHPQARVARRVLRAGGGMLALDVGTRERGAALIDALQIPERTASLGSVHTIAVHPPSTTHRQLDAAALANAGIAPGLVRISVGLEDATDLVADLLGALATLPAPSAGTSSDSA
jgi:methionine-gamma-lyase